MTTSTMKNLVLALALFLAAAPAALAQSTKLGHIDRQKLIIILVGLPGRGKTFLCNKLMCYLNWLGAPLNTEP